MTCPQCQALTERVHELEDEVEHWRHQAELPARIANADSAIIQLADARHEIQQLREAFRALTTEKK